MTTLLEDESRLFEFRSYSILDSGPDPIMDQIVNMAAEICGTEISFISVVDEGQQWFLAYKGLEISESPTDILFCQHTIKSSEVLVVPDTTLDDRFANNPYVRGESGVRFYAGAPLITPSGHRIGTLCVISKTKQNLLPSQISSLQFFSRHVMDLFELRKKNVALEIMTEEYRSVQKMSKTGGWSLDPVSGEFSWSDEIYAIYGRALTEKADLSEFLRFHPMLLLGESFDREVEIEDTKKNKKWIRVVGKSDFDSHGKLIKIFGTFKDITESRRDREEQKRLKRQLVEAQAISRIGSWEFDVQTNELFWSDEHYKIFEIENPQPQAELYRLYRERIHPDYLVVLDRKLNKAFEENEHFSFDHRVILDSGKRIKYVQGISQAKRNAAGEITVLSGTCRDRTADVEKELSYQTLIESMSEGLIVIDHTGIVEHNSAALSILGLKAEELLESKSLPVGWRLIRENGEIYPFRENPAIFSLQTGKSISSLQLGIQKHLETTWINLNTVVIESNTGRKVISTFTDITALLLERTKTLHNSKLASIGQLAAGVGHEINNPLAVVSGFFHILEKKLTDHPEVSPMMRKIELAIERIANISKGLRVFARADNSENSVFDPNHLAQETVDLLRELYAKSGISLTLHHDVSVCLIRANRGRLQQVLVNLLSNAHDAVLNSTEKKNQVRTWFTESEFCFSVSDTGPGVRSEHRKRIFDPFYTTKDMNKGTGLGLSLVCNIVKEHEGTIELLPDVGMGAEFVVKIPNHLRGDSLSLDASKESVRIEKMPVKVLIVDDEPHLLEIMAISLEDLCEVVHTASSAEEGLAILRRSSVHLILSDLKMPGMDGLEFFRLIKKEFPVQTPGFIFISGGVDLPPAIEIYMQENSLGVLSKPINLVDLREVITKSFHARVIKSS